ncbi:solute carrier family 35 member C2 isoform 6-T13 [Spheniscus humboldti]
MAGVGGAALGRAALLVLLYYGFSIGIVFYNKWLMKSFPFPLLATLLHLLLIFGLSALARALARCRSGRPRAALSWADCLRWAAPAALSTSLDIGLSNWSFLYVTVSLYTMTKSSAILFILLFSLLFKLEEVRVALLLVVLLIAGGLFMFTYKSTQFNAQGFVLVLCASFLGGIRWTLTQILMQKADLGLQNPIDIMFHLQPLMFLGLFPLFAVFEGNLHFIPRHTFAGRPPQSFELAGLCCLSVRNLPSCHSQSHEFQRCSSSPRDEAFFAFLARALNLQNHQQELHGKQNCMPLRNTENRHTWHSAQLYSFSHGCFLQKPLLQILH